MISLDDLAFLASDAGARLLTRLADEDLDDAHTLRLVTALRREVSPSTAGAALELARARRDAVDKFGADAGRLYLTRAALEQASHRHIRRYRAGQVAAGERVVDLCCAVGSDSLAFAAAGAQVVGVDIDPVRIAMARLNAAALDLTADFVVADAHAYTPPPADLIFYDPARRSADGRRLHHVEHYQPPLSLIRRWHGSRLVKLSPAVEREQLAAYGGTVEFLSVEGDLKEAALYTTADGAALTSQAVLLAGGSVHRWTHPDAQPIVDTPRGWLLEPDPALLRAGAVASAAHAWNAAQLDRTIAYLTSDTPPATPWMRAWRILDWLPFNVKALRAYLRARGVGQVTVRKRGSPLTPETLIPQLRLSGDSSRTLVLTRAAGKPIVVVCADYVPPG